MAEYTMTARSQDTWIQDLPAQMGVQGTAAECLKYQVDPNVVWNILADKYVPIYKILPGFRGEGTNIVLLWIQLVTGVMLHLDGWTNKL